MPFMKHFSKYVVVATLLGLGVLGIWWYDNQSEVIPLAQPNTPRSYYEPLVPMILADVPVFVSVANTTETRQLGLSSTTMLPPDVVKLFVFSTADRWSFWMKEMQYAIDIIWLDAAGQVVHIEEQVAPSTYPTAFVPEKPATYVIETNAGFVAAQDMAVGDTVMLPENID